jgi:pyruvate/2-oxoacid:ferredoxin oxidoreductase beta subunit
MNNEENFLIKDENVYPGALSCRGCGWTLLVRHLSSILGEDTVYVVPASCFSIIAGPYPMNSVKGTIVHTLFAAASATATGVRAALDRQGKHHAQVVVLAGDGGTFDIGLQAMSGAASRGENIIYVCNNNGAYMNTGVQTSTATPYGAVTTTSPSGKKGWPKNLVDLVAAHNIPYLATASLAYLNDLREKVTKAKEATGFRFLMIDSPCPPGHKYPPEMSIDISRQVVESGLFPLLEVEEGAYKLNYIPEKKIPVAGLLKKQGRFAHLFKNGSEILIEEIQERVDREWELLLKKVMITNEL